MKSKEAVVMDPLLTLTNLQKSNDGSHDVVFSYA
jgi:hypothetical protein